MEVHKLPLLIGLWCSFLAAGICANPPHYNVTVLEDTQGGTSMPMSINARGQVAGVSDRDAVIWEGTKPKILGTLLSPERAKALREWTRNGKNLPPLIGWGYSMNAAGQVAGCTASEKPDHSLEDHLVRWTNLEPTDLATTLSEFNGFGINASGQVVGREGNSAVLWTGTTPTVLGLGTPHAINDAGQVAGVSGKRAVRWIGTVMTELDSLGGSISSADAINASGQVAGFSYLANGKYFHAVVWTGTKATDLGTLEGGNCSFAVGINAAGDTVGVSTTAHDESVRHPFLFLQGKLYNLQDLIIRNQDIREFTVSRGGNCINDAGQIVGNAFIEGKSRAIILTPEK